MNRTHRLSLWHAARRTPQQPAVIASGEMHSYHQLARDVARAVRGLKARGVVAGRRTVIEAEPGYRCLVTLHALIALGAPVALADSRWSKGERAEMLRALEPVEELACDEQDGGRTLDDDRVLDELGAPIPDDARPLVLVATSGTSRGRGRWTVLSRAAWSAAIAASEHNLGWRRDDRWLLSLPLAHVGGLSIPLRTLAACRTVVTEALDWQRAQSILETVEKRRVTLLSLVPTQLERLLASSARPAPACLRAVLVGGAAAPRPLLEEAINRGWPVLATFGATESCGQVTTWHPADAVHQAGCGPPLEGRELRIAGHGAIELRGAGLMTGYLPLAGPQPFTADGWLGTGDQGFIDAHGNLHVLGRSDDVIISGGENIHPHEVEQALTSHPSIRQALVFALPDDAWGQVVAALLVARGPQPDEKALLAHCRSTLARFKQPRKIAWVERLPRTPADKPDRKAARTLARQHTPRLHTPGEAA